MGTEAPAGRRGSQDGDSEQEDVGPEHTGLQESSPERSLIGGPEQEKEFGPAGGAAATAAAVVQAFRGRLYRPHRDGELLVSGRRLRRGGEASGPAGGGRRLRGWVRGEVDMRRLGVWP